MGLFYNPKTKKPQAWIFIFFIIIPILIIAITYILGQSSAKKNQNKQQESDIFAK